MAPSFDPTVLSSFEKDTLISTLLAQVDALTARVAALESENAALREQLTAPPKTPDNSVYRTRLSGSSAESVDDAVVAHAGSCDVVWLAV